MTSQPPPISLSPATSDPNPDTSSSDPTPSPSALLHLLTLKHLSDAGFASTSRAASITLSSVLERYILATASACAKKAEHAGRRKVGSLDMVQVLEDRQGKGWVRDMEHWVGERGVREEWAGEGWERGLEGLEEQLETGLTLPQAMADLVVVPDDEVDEEEDSDSSDEHGEEAGTGDMEVDKVKVEEDTKPYLPPSLFRAGSPDTSWLPPLPTMSADPSYTPAPQSALAAIGNAKTPSGDYTARPSGPTRDDNELAGPSSLYAKFMTPLSFAESQISESFIDPSKGPALTKPVYEEPPQRSTLPSLLKAYEAIKNEGSVSLAQTPLRMQAGDLLKRVICPPDFDSAPDTLTYPLPGPKVPLGMASYSRPPDASAGEVSPDAALGGKGILPEPRIPINAQPDGVLARLVREMRSPYLPPSFRDRMLHVTPPPPLLAKDGTPILYGDPVRGPDRAALEVARGKPAPAPEEGAEEYYRYTYDPGPMGVEKWGRKLDVKSMGGERGRRVEASAVGEEVPRVERKVGAVTGALDGQSNGAREQQEGGPVQVRLRLDRTMTTPQVDVAVKDRQGQVTHGAGAAGPVGTAAAILEQAAEHENGDVVMAEANIFAPPPSMTTSALSASPSTTMHNQAQTASSPRASISLAPPRIRISTNSASPGAPSPAAAAQSAQSTSPLPAPPSATPPPAPPTPGTTGGVKIRLGGSFSAGGSAPKRPSSAVSPASAGATYAESPINSTQHMSPAGSYPIETNGEGDQAGRPAKRPTMKIRLPTAGVKQEHGI